MQYYIDLGSSTVKLYQKGEELEMIEEKSIQFKSEFTKEKGISEENFNELIDFLKEMKTRYKLGIENTTIYATGIFRNIEQNIKEKYIVIFIEELNLYFNVISHGIENYYLEKAMINNYNDKKVLVINMGGKTTELVAFKNNKIVSRYNLTFGVVDILIKFPNINKETSEVTVEEIKEFINNKLVNEKFDNNYDCAIFTGGEERFEKLTNFALVPNTLFNDGIHKYMITYDNYIKCTKKVFFDKKYTMKNLCELMPHNPKWMEGSRAGAALPIAIFERTNVKYIVPSDLNLINGVLNDK